MGLTRQQQMPELWELRKALIDAEKTIKLDEKQANERYDDNNWYYFIGKNDGFKLVIRWIDQFFEPEPTYSDNRKRLDNKRFAKMTSKLLMKNSG